MEAVYDVIETLGEALAPPSSTHSWTPTYEDAKERYDNADPRYRYMAEVAYRAARLVSKNDRLPELEDWFPPAHADLYRQAFTTLIERGRIRSLRLVPEALASDRDFVLAAVERDGGLLATCPEQWQRDPEICQAALMEEASLFLYVKDEAFWADPDRVLGLIRRLRDEDGAKAHGDSLLKRLSESHLDDPRIVQSLLEYDYRLYVRLPEDVRGRPEVAGEAGMRLANDTLRRNLPDVYSLLDAMPPSFLQERGRDILVPVMRRHDAPILWYAPEELRSDPEVVLESLRLGDRLEHVSEELGRDRDLAVEILRVRPDLFPDFDPALKNDPGVVLTLFDVPERSRVNAADVPPALWDDPQFIQEAVLRATRSSARFEVPAREAFNATMSDRDVVRSLVEQEGQALQYASPGLRDDLDIVSAAVSADPKALGFASPRIQQMVRQFREDIKYPGSRPWV